MMWPTKKLGEVCEMQSGFACAQRYKVESGGVVHLRTHNIDTSGEINTNLLIHIPEDKIIFKPGLLPGDVLFNNTNSAELVGKTALVREKLPYVFSNHITRIRTKVELLPEFLLYKLLALFKDAYFETHCTRWIGQAGFNQTQLKNLEISLPPLDEQKKIVKELEAKLGKVKVAIALREDALADTDKILPARLTEIFSEGKAKGWEEKALLDVTKSVADGTHDTPKYKDSGYPLVTSKNLRSEGLTFDTAKFISEGDYLEINKRSHVSKGDILIGMIGTIGNVTLVDTEKKFSIKNVGLIRPDETKVLGKYLRYYLDNSRLMSLITTGGTTQKFMALGTLRNIKISFPPVGEQKKVVQELDGLSARVAELRAFQQAQLTDLKSLQKSILHEAFTQ